MTSGVSEEHRDRFSYRVGDLEVDVGRVVVSRAGAPIPLPKLSFDLLLALIEQAPDVVTLDRLLDRVWAGLVVSPETVSQRVKLLRSALGDDPKEPRYIAGVRGRGYRLVPPVERISTSADWPGLQPASSAEPAAASPAPAMDPAGPRRRQRQAVTVLALLAGIALIVGFWAWRIARDAAAPDAPAAQGVPDLPARSIAVLPFRHVGHAADDSVLAEGVAESVLHQLAGVRGLTVIARTSSFLFGSEPRNPAEIGRALNARYLLEGSVQSEGARLRVTAQLVDATNGSQVWSLQFDRTPQDVFKVQDEIALEVARALAVVLDGGPGTAASRKTTGYDSYLAFLRGRALLSGLRATDLPAAKEALEASIARDPGFSPAYVLLARARVALAEYRAQPGGYDAVLAVVKEARTLVEKAIELDPGDGAAYVERGYLKAFTDLAGADADFRRGLELAPSLARGYEGLAAVRFESIARRREALELMEQARRLDPIDPRLAVTHAVYLFYGRADADGAAGILRAVLDRDPLYVPALARLAELEWASGALADTVSLAEQAIALDPDGLLVRRLLVQAYLDLGEEAAARTVVDESPVEDPVDRLLLHVHRGEWREAGGIAAALVESGRVPPMQERAVALALRMRARVSGDVPAAIRLFEDWTGVDWEDGQPLLGDSLSMRLDLTGLADLLQVSGDRPRARALAEEVLRDIDQQVGQFGRPHVWVDQARAAALLLLDRPDEALETVLRMARSGAAFHDIRSILELDPAFDPLRDDPAYRATVATFRDHARLQGSRLDGLRQEGLVPLRPRPASPAG